MTTGATRREISLRFEDIPDFFVYGEPGRALDVGFLHVERVQDRGSLHHGDVAVHRHAEMGQITLWTEGAGTYRIEDAAWTFSAPAVSFVPSGVAHGFTVRPGSDATVISVANPALASLGEASPLPLGGAIFATGGDDGAAWRRLAAVVGLVADEYRDGRGLRDGALPGLIAAALALIARLGRARPEAAASPTLRLAAALRRAVDAHFREDWTIARYVAELGTTPHLLDRAAREVLGASVKEAVLARRLLEAKRLLLFTIRPVEAVAYETGFRDPAYFSRFFARRCGAPPAAWRRAARAAT